MATREIVKEKCPECGSDRISKQTNLDAQKCVYICLNCGFHYFPYREDILHIKMRIHK